MLSPNLVRVCIEDLLISAYLGFHKSEQKQRRKIPVRVEFEYEQPAADSLTAAIDYREVRNAALAAAENRRFCLLETMARTILDAVRAQPRMQRVTVRVTKPRALKQARSVVAVVEWSRSDQQGKRARR